VSAAPPWLDELSEFLRIPSVSADGDRGQDVLHAAEWICDRVRAAGGEADDERAVVDPAEPREALLGRRGDHLAA